ncbi:alpha/beta fold hydrolase [Streptomyces sp. NPDC049954]|uniref:alpha/beta fold hydrolase n=1 Tax=Streptomyces sp. NPDC049954 TaxID=3155779 RepID=UPI003412478B
MRSTTVDGGAVADTSPGARALVLAREPAGARHVALLLHGGRSEGRQAARPWQLAALRMRPFASALSRVLPTGSTVLGTVRYRYRGWNGGAADALGDTVAALDELERRTGGLPVVLLGHSMGGRAALRAAAHPSVRAVVALAPWCPEGEPVEQLTGTGLVVLHGDHDRVTSARASWALLRRAEEAGARTAGVCVAGGEHTMLRRAPVWQRTAAGAVAGLLEVGPYPAAVTQGFASEGPVTV